MRVSRSLLLAASVVVVAIPATRVLNAADAANDVVSAAPSLAPHLMPILPRARSLAARQAPEMEAVATPDAVLVPAPPRTSSSPRSVFGIPEFGGRE